MGHHGFRTSRFLKSLQFQKLPGQAAVPGYQKASLGSPSPILADEICAKEASETDSKKHTGWRNPN